jgi:hypothetical protein
MLIFLKKIILLLACILIPAYLLEIYISHKLSNGYRYYFQGDWHDLAGHNSDILFVGNSRTWTQVNPFQVQQALGVRAEIIAADGQDVHFVWEKFKTYIQVNKLPSEVYLQFDPLFVFERNDLYGAYNIQTCFFGGRVDLSSLSDRKGFKWIYYFIPMAAYKPDFLLKVIKNDTLPFGDSFEQKRGFQSRNLKWSGDWLNPERLHIDMNRVSTYVDSFVVFAKQNQIDLYFLYPPQSDVSYRKSMDTTLFLKSAGAYRQKHDFEMGFLNMNHSNVYSDSTLFYNHLHLNARGVDVYMRQLLNDSRAFKRWR